MTESEACEILLRFWKQKVSPRYKNFYRIHLHSRNHSIVKLPLWLNKDSSTYEDLAALISCAYFKNERVLNLNSVCVTIPSVYTKDGRTQSISSVKCTPLHNMFKDTVNPINIYLASNSRSGFVYNLPDIPGIYHWKGSKSYSICKTIQNKDTTIDAARLRVHYAVRSIERCYRRSNLYKDSLTTPFTQWAYRDAIIDQTSLNWQDINFPLFLYLEKEIGTEKREQNYSHVASVLNLHCNSRACILWKISVARRGHLPLVYGYCDFGIDMVHVGTSLEMKWPSLYDKKVVKLVNDFFSNHSTSFLDVFKLVQFLNVFDAESHYQLSYQWAAESSESILVFLDADKSVLHRSDVCAVSTDRWTRSTTYKNVLNDMKNIGTYPILFDKMLTINDLWDYCMMKYNLIPQDCEMKIGYRQGVSRSFWAYRPHFINWASNMKKTVFSLFPSNINLELSITIKKLHSVRRTIIEDRVYMHMGNTWEVISSRLLKDAAQKDALAAVQEITHEAIQKCDSFSSLLPNTWRNFCNKLKKKRADFLVLEAMKENNWKFAYATPTRHPRRDIKCTFVRSRNDAFPGFTSFLPMKSKNFDGTLWDYMGIVTNPCLVHSEDMECRGRDQQEITEEARTSAVSKMVDEICEKTIAACLLQSKARRRQAFRGREYMTGGYVMPLYMKKHINSWRSTSIVNNSCRNIKANTRIWKRERKLLMDGFNYLKDNAFVEECNY